MNTYFTLPVLGIVLAVSILITAIWIVRRVFVQRAVRGSAKAAVGGGRRGRRRR